MPDGRRQLGIDGESAAAEWYVRQGYEVLERNWRCRDGELDLVLARDGHVVFCEVKTRSSDRYGGPAEAVGWRKQSRIRQLAARWLREGEIGAPRSIRFDVAAVRVAGGALAVDVIQDAF